MQKDSIKREQSQAGLSFAERKNRRSLAGGESNFRPQVKNKLLLLLALLLTTATGAWAQDAKHFITATYDEQTRSLEQPLPYATTVGVLYEAVTGEPFSDLISRMTALEMTLSGIGSTNTSVVSVGEFNGASTPVTVNADGKAAVALRFGSYAQGIFVTVTPPLYVTMADGTKDAGKWTVKVGEGEAQALPIGGLKGDGSETVTLQYNGRLKVKGVKATSDAAPAAAADNPAPTTAAIDAYTGGAFAWDGDGSAATVDVTINTFAANDGISILSAKNANTKFTTTAGGASATFSGTATDDAKFYAVYPYTAGLTLSGDVISGVVIPSDQWNDKWGNNTENESSWDPKAPIAYATTTGSSLQFHNLCAILIINPYWGGDGWITISADQDLAGTFSLDTSTGTLTATAGSKTVTIGSSSGLMKRVMGMGEYMYIAIAPGEYTNFKVRTDEDHGGAEKTKASVTFEAGKIYNLGKVRPY